jgi:predicted DsbA family dithiol-disulfide isomerase
VHRQEELLMTTPVKIDFVSDVSCPWCVIGLKALEAALERVAGEVTADIHFQPFELNPQMPAQGEDVAEHIARKYGSSAEEQARSRETLRARGAELGFEFALGQRKRIYNTFDAHRLLHWAEGTGKQEALKNALFAAYFTEGRNPSDPQVLESVAAQVGLDANRVREILASNEYADEVRAREQWYLDRGIHAVPAVILNERYLIQGGQPVEVFEAALRKVAAEAGAPHSA